MALGMKGNIQMNKYINNFKNSPLWAKVISIVVLLAIIVFAIMPFMKLPFLLKVILGSILLIVAFFTVFFIVAFITGLFRYVFFDRKSPKNSFWDSVF